MLVAPAHYWLGVADYRQSGLSQSSRNLKAALRVAEASGDIYQAHQALEALALNYSELGELGTSLGYVSRMLPEEGRYYRTPNQALRDTWTLAELTLRLDFFSTSLHFAREGFGLSQELYPASGRVNSALRLVVSAAAAKGDYASALSYAEESRRISEARGDGPDNAGPRAEARRLLADVKGPMGDCAGALSDYDEALALYARLPGFTVNAYPIHKGRLFCFQRLGRLEEFDAELKTVLALSEEYRTTIREDDSRRAFFTNEQTVFDAAVGRSLGRGDAAGAFTSAETSRARSLLDFVESDRPIAEVEREFGAVARPLALEEIRARLPDGVQLVEYAVLPDRLAVWVVSRGRFELFEREVTAAELERKVDDYQAAIVGREPAPAVRRAARELYDLLLPPGLEREGQLCLVPDKALHRLAFASLVAPSDKYLLEEYALSYAPSGSVLVLATENARRRARGADETLLSVGNPDFDREENAGLADLRAAAEEARAVARLYPRATELTGAAATRERFLRGFGEADVIHFAGHFVVNRQSPANSKLLFAGGDLRSSELGAYKLARAKLVVLSACETGFESYDKGEGAVGVSRTFLALGAPVVVASQWAVDSEATRDLMVAFHRNRRERGLTSAESLRRAQLELLGRAETAAPFSWAAFALSGGYADY